MNGEKVDYRDIALSNKYADYIVALRTDPESFNEEYRYLGAEVLNSYYGLLHVDFKTDPFTNIKTFGFVGIPKLFTLLDTTSLDVSGITQVQTQPYLNLSGKDIIMGYLDTGIEYTNTAFRKLSGKSRIISLWDQTIQTGKTPEGFYFGSEYSKEDIDKALESELPYEVVPSKDENGHGTFIAGVGAGSKDLKNNFTGVAPDCDIAVVKLKQAKQYLREYYFANPNENVYQESDIMLGIRYLALLGKRLNKPVVITIALGTNQGDHDGNAPIDNMVATLPTIYPNVTAVIAAGNESGRAHHYLGKIADGNEYDELEILVKPETPGFTTEIWGDPPSVYSISLVSPLGEVIPRISVRLGKTEEISFVLEKTTVQILFELVQTTSGAQLIFLRFANPTQGIWKIRVYCSSCGTKGYNMWLPVTNLLEKDVTFLNPNPDTTITVPGYAANSITTSTYNAYNKSIYLYSSRGYSRSGVIKPDFASPGVDVEGPTLGGNYVKRSGSSIAASIAAGCVALLLQWGAQRTPPRYYNVQELRVLFIRGATRSPSLTYPNKEWGYGELNIYNIFLSLINN